MPIPYAAHLEEAALPQAPAIVAAARALVKGAMTEFRMPSLGADMEAGTLVEWLVKPGDRVKRGDVVAVVETQKGAIEVEIFNDGVVSELVVPVGAARAGRHRAGAARRRGDGAGAPAPPAAPPVPAAVAPAPAVAGHRRAPPAPRRSRCRRRAAGAVSPAARRLAAERGIDARAPDRDRPGGAITLADVEAAPPKRRRRPHAGRRPGRRRAASIPRRCARRSPPR